MLHQVIDTTAGYMRAWGECLEERLLDIPERVRDAVEYDIHHGAIIALVAA
jgi:hypothetical protein